MKNLIETREGWAWPKSDTNCWRYMKKYPDLPYTISSRVKNKSVVVKAGGNCGYYVKQYANLFDKVYTYEPDFLNFYCLNLNVEENNVIKTQGCLGSQRGTVDLVTNNINVGKTHIKQQDGIYPVYLVDDIRLNACDLIHLDIEGYEYYAILGAMETIKKFRPVVVLEVWEQLENRFEEDINTKLHDLMLDLGYHHSQTLCEADKVYEYRG
jgi:FkbM family methyltransferase